jgi:RimJ/RimL family protein N-acetyltransferase
MKPLHELQTARLRIRRFTPEDADTAMPLLDQCFGPKPRAERQDWLDWTVRNYVALERLHQPPYGDYAVVLAASDELIGAVGLVPSYGPFDLLPAWCALSGGSGDRITTEMGLFWAIAGAHRGCGYATEAGAAMMNFAFEELRSARLVATTEHDNAASIAVMRRLGMTIERNPRPEPAWFQIIGIRFAPALADSLGPGRQSNATRPDLRG